jgi:glycosyltransferase involved in cell wall biosynthesis
VIRILFLGRYSRLGASSRLRLYQYRTYLEQNGFQVCVSPLLGDHYIKRLYSGAGIPMGNVVKAYVVRLIRLLQSNNFDAVWIEKEALPWLPSWIELGLFPRELPMIVDYDDAVFHRYDMHPLMLVRAVLGQKIDAVMRRADLVTVGNDYLGDRARRAGARRVELLPTVVNEADYAVERTVGTGPFTIGWIGSPSTAHYLHLIGPVLRNISNGTGARIVAVGANSEQLKGLPVEVIPWSEQTEVSEIQRFDIGVMPLADGSFERGKCGYKLIQYMACGKPVVASPVGANKVIVRDDIEGYLPCNVAQWGYVLQKLSNDTSLRHRLGDAGRRRVAATYSLKVTAPRLEKLIRSVLVARCAV